jgi:hypothetical protein
MVRNMRLPIRGEFARRQSLTGVAMLFALTAWAMAAELRPPATVEAGQAFSIPADGSGKATFYLIGPDHVVKHIVNLGSDLQVESGDVRAAGRYQAIICQRSCTSATFDVKAAQPAHLSFFLHPSRVPVSLPDSIGATVFVFDQYFNLVLSPAAVDFQITPAEGAGQSRRASTRNGVAWIHMNSSSREGLVRVSAVLGRVSEARVIQQVAAEACALHVSAIENGKIVTLRTDPVRDCSGNALPDGTIVSFTVLNGTGKSTVDAPIKKGIAQTAFNIAGPARISVACGVVLGNEVSLGGKL